MKNRYIVMAALGLFLSGSLSLSAYGQKKHKAKTAKNADSDSVEPDKLLYDRATQDVKKGRYIEARLSFQTLINTYPDSEYLAKAKLGVADSYYKEGGTSNIVQAVQEYKDFITFFPFLDEAAYAQMQVGMAYYRMMEKSDRDTSTADSAEQELQTFLLKYPDSLLRPKAEQDLRDVQEVIADGQFRVARFYYVKPDYRASAARLVELTERYPLYSQSDEALWMLGGVYSKMKQLSRNEDDKNHWADLAGQCYSRIIQNYPLSKRAAEARGQLTAMGMAVPKPDPGALARMQKEQLYAKNHHGGAFVKAPISLVKQGPDVALAAHSGEPNLNPPDDAVSATEVLKPGAGGPSFNLAMRPATAADPNQDNQTSDVGPVEAASTLSSAGPASSVGAEIISVGPTGAESAPAPATAPSPLGSGSGTASSPTSTSAPAVISNGPPPAEGAPNSGNAPPGTEAPSLVTTQTTTATTGSNGTGQPSTEKAKSDSKTESTSKKKKGVHKLIPF